MKIKNPVDGSIGETSDEAFELVWQPKGWTQVDDDVRTTAETVPTETFPGRFDSMKKDELVDEANRHGVDASGTKAEIAERLRAAGLEG